MSSGMNTEQAKEYAKTMTYSQAVSNIKHGKGIKYRKATMIKLRELAEIADRLDRKTENSSEKPNNCEPQTDYKKWDAPPKVKLPTGEITTCVSVLAAAFEEASAFEDKLQMERSE